MDEPNERPFFTTAAGIRYYWKDEGSTKVLTQFQDVDHILDRNRAMESHNDGYSPSRELRRVASIPLNLIFKWKTEEGWDPFSPDPDCQRRLKAKLNSIEYRYLRTAPGVV